MSLSESIGRIANYGQDLLVATFGLFAIAVAAYARTQIAAAVRWAVVPLAKHFPWNSRHRYKNGPARLSPPLLAELTIVEVNLEDGAGRFAAYKKISSFSVVQPLTSYWEGVTCAGSIGALSTMRGKVAGYVQEHGFYLARIELGSRLREGEIFTNIFSAILLNSFQRHEEQWTQEIALPTRHLTLQVHFPKDRPPGAFRSLMLEGTSELPARESAEIVELFGRKSIVWEIPSPRLKDVYKLSWSW